MLLIARQRPTFYKNTFPYNRMHLRLLNPLPLRSTICLHRRTLLIKSRITILIRSLCVKLKTTPTISIRATPILLRLMMHLIRVVRMQLSSLNLNIIRHNKGMIRHRHLVGQGRCPLLMIIALRLRQLMPYPRRFPNIPSNITRHLTCRHQTLVITGNMSCQMLTTNIRRRRSNLTIIMNNLLMDPYLTIRLFIRQLPLLMSRFRIPSIRYPMNRNNLQDLTLILRLGKIPRSDNSTLIPRNNKFRRLPMPIRHSETLSFQFPRCKNCLIMLFRCLYIIRVRILKGRLIRSHLILLIPCRNNKHITLILIRRDSRTFHLVLIRLAFRHLSHQEGFIKVTNITFTIPRLRRIIRRLARPIPCIRAKTTASRATFHVTIARPSSYVRSAYLRHMGHSLLQSRQLSHAIPMNNRRKMNNLIMPCHPLGQTNNNAFSVLVKVAMVFSMWLLCMCFRQIRLRRNKTSRANALNGGGLLSIRLHIVYSWQRRTLLKTRLAFQVVRSRLINMSACLIVVSCDRVGHFAIWPYTISNIKPRAETTFQLPSHISCFSSLWCLYPVERERRAATEARTTEFSLGIKQELSTDLDAAAEPVATTTV